MKKIAFLFASLAFLFTACDKENESTQETVTLTADMVEVNDIADPLIVVDNRSRTITIEIAYVEKDALKALEVSFTGLPEGVAANPASSTFDYSTGARKEITMSKGSWSEVWTITATVAEADPHFISAALNGVEADGCEAKLSGSTDLTKVVFSFEVSPADTKVYIGSTEVSDGDEVDFSDKMNGVTFTLRCGGVEKIETIKVITTGISSVERLWGHYVKPQTVADDWFGTAVQATGWERNIAMDSRYVYMAKAKTGADKGCYVLDINNGSLVKELSVEGMEESGVHHTSAVRVIENGQESIVLICNLINNSASPLRVWAYDNIDSAPRKVLEYTAPSAGTPRLGDKFTVEGDWQNGKLWFFDYNGSTPRAAYVFTVTGGTVSSQPQVIEFDTAVNKLGNIGGVFKYGDNEYLWAGAASQASTFTLSGNVMTQGYALTDGGRFSYPMHGVSFFTFNDQKYMSFVRLLNSFKNGALRIMELNGETLAESLETGDVTKDLQYGLADPQEMDLEAVTNGNGLGDSDLRVINGETYIVAMVPGSGVSLFKLN